MSERRRIPRFLPVVHVEDPDQAKAQVALAVGAGVLGVFLIAHDLPARGLTLAYHQVRREFPDLWVGLNYLDQSPLDAAIILPADADALWTDHAAIGTVRRRPRPEQIVAAKIQQLIGARSWFAGVAFKYQPELLAPAVEAAVAAAYADVLTTSGPATGKPASLEHVRAVAAGAGARPIALASGVDADNIASYLPLVRHFLVASSISRDFHTFDKARLADLAGRIPEED